MPTFDSAWDDITDASEITATLWNDLFNDIESFLTNIDDTFFVAGAIQPTVVDGTAMTLDDLSAGASEQLLSRETRHTGLWTQDGEVLQVETVEDALDLTPSVNSVRVLRINNATSGAVSIARFDDPTEGQVLLVIGSGADDITLTDATLAAAATAGEIVSGEAAWHTGVASGMTIQAFRASTFGGQASVIVWGAISTKITFT